MTPNLSGCQGQPSKTKMPTCHAYIEKNDQQISFGDRSKYLNSIKASAQTISDPKWLKVIPMQLWLTVFFFFCTCQGCIDVTWCEWGLKRVEERGGSWRTGEGEPLPPYHRVMGHSTNNFQWVAHRQTTSSSPSISLAVPANCAHRCWSLFFCTYLDCLWRIPRRLGPVCQPKVHLRCHNCDRRRSRRCQWLQKSCCSCWDGDWWWRRSGTASGGSGEVEWRHRVKSTHPTCGPQSSYHRCASQKSEHSVEAVTCRPLVKKKKVTTKVNKSTVTLTAFWKTIEISKQIKQTWKFWCHI